MKEKGKVINIDVLRKNRQEEERRQNQRVLFKNVLNAYTVIEEKGLLQVQLIDLSETGLRFAMHTEYGMFHKNEKLAFRLYFSQNDYLPVTIKVIHRQQPKSGGTQDPTLVEYGCQFVAVEKEIRACIQDLVHFIKRYTEVARNDSGDRQVYFL